MKDILKVWLRGYDVRGPTVFFGSFFTIIGLSLLVSSFLGEKNSGVMFVGGVILTIMGLSVWIIGFILPFLEIKRFKKEFGFLPPVTSEEKDALQRVVDAHLGSEVRNLGYHFKRQNEALKELKNLSQQQQTPNSATFEDYKKAVFEFGDNLRNYKEYIRKAKRDFRRKQAIASNSYLPQPFRILEKIDDYKDVTFEKPAKHEKDKDVGVDGRGHPSRGQGG